MLSRFDSPSIARKLSRINLLTTGTAGLLIAVILITGSWYNQRSDLAKDAQIKANVIADGVSAAMLFSDQKAANETLAMLEKDVTVLEARVFDQADQPFATFIRIPSDTHKEAPALIRNMGGGSHLDFQLTSLTITRPILSSATDMTASTEANANQVGTLLMKIDLHGLYKRVLQFSILIVATVLIALVLASILLHRMQRSITVPIRKLSKVMSEVSQAQDYTRRAEVRSQDEIGSLAHSFNKMVEEIQKHDNLRNQEIITRKNAEAQLDIIAHTDNVTNLPNRHFFNRRASDLMQANKSGDHRIALLFIDLDNFKYVNDTFGHQSGDLVLVSVADRMKTIVRNSDVVARFGGDEFAILLDNPSNIEQATKVAQKILDSFHEVFTLNKIEVHVSASIGIAMLPEHAVTIDELLQYADAAMYHAKDSGKNNIKVWSPETSRISVKYFEMESGLRKALLNNEFILHYQPIVALESDEIVGMEALIRWKKPDGGLVPPIEFIPIAEETGLIIPIGEWVLKTACATVYKWQQQYGSLFLAVNVSAKQFQYTDLPQVVASVLEETYFPATSLELEMTESLLMNHSTELRSKFDKIAKMGVGLSLDDFGTGYSSLLYLKRFPITKLKIDRGFINDLPGDVEVAAITQAIISIAKSLNLKVVAEGIEASEQAAYLRQHYCEFGQGYYYSKPVDAAAFSALLEKKKVTQSKISAA